MRVVVAIALVVMLAGCEGPQGPQGPAGDRGPAGPAGAPGAAVVETRACISNVVSVGNEPALYFSYARYKFADGSVMATCEVADPAASYSGVAMYSATMQGSVDGACLLVYDVDARTGGYWTFTLSNTIASIVYTDSSSANNKRTITMQCPVQ